jgi:DNA mismatch endonuclease, patch repair protein
LSDFTSGEFPLSNLRCRTRTRVAEKRPASHTNALGELFIPRRPRLCKQEIFQQYESLRSWFSRILEKYNRSPAMTDIFKPKRRSEIMRGIRPTNTMPEIAVRSIIHRLGFRFRLHAKDLPGTPDIVLPRLRKIVLVNGCFWHSHAGCRKAALPKSRIAYWREKLKKNVARDRSNKRALKKLGWDVLVVWQCSLRNAARLRSKLEIFLRR